MRDCEVEWRIDLFRLHSDDMGPRSVVIKYPPPPHTCDGPGYTLWNVQTGGYRPPTANPPSPLSSFARHRWIHPPPPPSYLRMLISEGRVLGYRILGLISTRVHTQHHICRGHLRVTISKGAGASRPWGYETSRTLDIPSTAESPPSLGNPGVDG